MCLEIAAAAAAAIWCANHLYSIGHISLSASRLLKAHKISNIYISKKIKLKIVMSDNITIKYELKENS